MKTKLKVLQKNYFLANFRLHHFNVLATGSLQKFANTCKSASNLCKQIFLQISQLFFGWKIFTTNCIFFFNIQFLIQIETALCTGCVCTIIHAVHCARANLRPKARVKCTVQEPIQEQQQEVFYVLLAWIMYLYRVRLFFLWAGL